MLSILLLLLILPIFQCLPPPEGLSLKRAKQISGEGNGQAFEPPPNLQLRSRMMAALNSHAQPIAPERINSFAQPLILTKTRKFAKTAKPVAPEEHVTVAPVHIAPQPVAPSSSRLSPEEVRRKFSSVGDETVNLKVRPVLKTNFVDANGKVVHDLVSVPIRVSDGQIHSIPKNSKNATSSSSVVETEKDVNVSFRSSLPLWLI